MNQSPSKLSRNYELIRWNVYVIVGGLINGLALNAFVDFYLNLRAQTTTQESELSVFIQLLPQTGISLLLLLATPLGLSLILTRRHPEKRIVPPGYLHLIAFFLYILFLYKTPHLFTLNILIPLFAYVAIVGITQEKITTSIFGVSAQHDDLIVVSLKAHSTREIVAGILTVPKFRNQLGLTGKVEPTERGLVLRVSRKSIYQTIVELREEKQFNWTFINVVFYEKGQYYIKRTEALEEHARDQIAYLKDILSRSEHPVVLEDASLDQARPLVYSIMDEMKGLSLHGQEITTIGWLKIVSFLALVIVPTIGYFLGQLPLADAVGLVLSSLVIVVLELPSRLKRD